MHKEQNIDSNSYGSFFGHVWILSLISFDISEMTIFSCHVKRCWSIFSFGMFIEVTQVTKLDWHLQFFKKAVQVWHFWNYHNQHPCEEVLLLDIMMLRFFKLIKGIFEELDDKSLTNVKLLANHGVILLKTKSFHLSEKFKS